MKTINDSKGIKAEPVIKAPVVAPKVEPPKPKPKQKWQWEKAVDSLTCRHRFKYSFLGVINCRTAYALDIK